MAFPPIILALGLMAARGSSENNVIIALVAILLPGATRVVRSQPLSIKELGSVNHRLAFCAYPLDLGHLPATASMIEASECMLSPFDDHPVARFQVQND